METANRAVETGPKLGSGNWTQVWAVETEPYLGSGNWTQIGQWILDPNRAVDTGPNLGSGYCVIHSVEISQFFYHSDFT